MEEIRIGSLTTPTTEAVADACGYLKAEVSRYRPGRNAHFGRLSAFHNRFTNYTAFFLALACGARYCARYGWSALLGRGQWFTYFDDKKTPPFGLPHPMLVPSLCVEQVQLFKSHCELLLDWLQRRECGGAALRRRLARIVASEHVDLLFHIKGEGPVALGAKELQDAIPAPLGQCVVGDSGRHYFGTLLHDTRVEESYLDAFLRHSEGGAERASSTSTVALRKAYLAVCPIIDQHSLELGLSPLAGLAGRV